MNNSRTLSYLILSIIIVVIFSCENSNKTAVEYAKRASITWRFNDHTEKVTLEFALNDLVKRFNGSIRWYYININDYDEISQKILKSEYQNSKFNGINILNSNHAVLGEIILAIVVNNARWRIVEADFTGFNFTPRTYNIFNFASDLNLIAEIIDDDNDKSYYPDIKELNSKLLKNHESIQLNLKEGGCLFCDC